MKRALVTGGSGAIGGTICRKLAADGLFVLIHANSKPKLARELAEEINNQGGFAEAVCFDVRDSQHSKEAIEHLLHGGPVQVLVTMPVSMMTRRWRAWNLNSGSVSSTFH